MQVNKIVYLLEKGIELERVKEHGIRFLSDNVEIARLLFDDKDTRYEEMDLGFIQADAIKFVLERKLTNNSGLKLGAESYIKTDKDIEFFVNQVLEFISMDEKEIPNFRFMYSEFE